MAIQSLTLEELAKMMGMSKAGDCGACLGTGRRQMDPTQVCGICQGKGNLPRNDMNALCRRCGWAYCDCEEK